MPKNLGVQDEDLRANNEQQFIQEMEFAFHLKSDGFFAIKLTNQDPEALGACFKNKILPQLKTSNRKFWIELPMVDWMAFSSVHCRDSEEIELVDQWMIWSKFQAATGFSPAVKVRRRTDVCQIFVVLF